MIIPPPSMYMPQVPGRGTTVANPAIRDGHMPLGAAKPKQSAAEIRAIQQFLRNQGYNIPVNGKWEGYTESAVKNWHKGKGKRNPGLWNKAVGLAATPAKGTDVGTGAAPSGGGTPSGGGGGNPGLDSFDPYSLAVGDPGVNRGLDVKLANGGASLIDKSFAERLAGLEYDSQIRHGQIQQERQGRDQEQALHDIGQWYGQVGKSVDTARGRGITANADGRNSILAATKAIVASLGGGANAASGIVGSMGASDAATLGAMGTAESQYLADMQPLLASEGAGAKTQERARQTMLAQDMANNLSSLRGERGAAKGKYEFDILQANNGIRDNRLSRLLELQQYNNTARQQNWTNELSAEQARIAAMLSGAQADSYAPEAGGFTPWVELDPSQKQQLITAALSNSINGSGALLGNTKSAWNLARKYLLGQGYTGINSKGTAVRKQMEALIQAGVMRAYRVKQEQDAIRAQQTG
jgi:hypothetical protein